MQDFISNYVGPEYAVQAYWAAIVGASVLAVLVIWLIYRLLRPASLSSNRRAKQARLAITDAAKVDDRRSLVLLRRDDVEHLIMIGGPTDIVIEGDIRRNAPARPLAAAQQEPVAPARNAMPANRVVTPPPAPPRPVATPDPAPESIAQAPTSAPETSHKPQAHPPEVIETETVARPPIKKTVRVAHVSPVSPPAAANNSSAQAAKIAVAAAAAGVGTSEASFADMVGAAPETVKKAADGVAEFAKAAVAPTPETAPPVDHAAMFADANATDTALSSQQPANDAEEFVPLVASPAPAPSPEPSDPRSNATGMTQTSEPNDQASVIDRVSDESTDEVAAGSTPAANMGNGNGADPAKTSMVDQMDALLNEIGPRN